MTDFTPVSATIGGALIGLSAVLLMLLTGRIAGISGIISGAAFGGGGEKLWRIFFGIGLVGAPGLYFLLARPAISVDINVGPTSVILGGLLVGFGTRLGSGCTSGHGVCGLSRLSPRSMLAVVVFMLSGMFTVAVVRHLIGG
jgi:uncharacterized membrane protein YedE/YeeE